MTSLIKALPGAVSQGLIWGIMAIGLYITYKILDIADLTVDGSFCTGGAVCAMMLVAGHNVYVAMLVALLAGMAAGLVTGLFHTKLGIPAILSGILTQLGLWSVNLAIMDMRANQVLNPANFNMTVSLRYLEQATKGFRSVADGFRQLQTGVPGALGLIGTWLRHLSYHPIFVVSVFTVVIILILYWFFGTELGASVRATGANIHMARAQGIHTDRNKVLGLMISNGLVALSGALLAQFQGFADVNMGRGAIVIGLAAIIIGSVLFGKLFRNFGLKLLAVSIGAVIYYVVIQAVISLSKIDSNYLKLISALIVAVFLSVPHLRTKAAQTYKRMRKERSHAEN